MITPTSGVFEALGDSTRRAILQKLSDGETTAGDIGRAIEPHARMSQPAVSQHLKVLREAGLVVVRSDGKSRIYAIEPTAIHDAQEWLLRLVVLSNPFEQRLDALDTEVTRGKRQRKQQQLIVTGQERSRPTAS